MANVVFRKETQHFIGRVMSSDTGFLPGVFNHAGQVVVKGTPLESLEDAKEWILRNLRREEADHAERMERLEYGA